MWYLTPEYLDKHVPGWRELSVEERRSVTCPTCEVFAGLACFQKGDRWSTPTRELEHKARIEMVMQRGQGE